MKPRDSSHPFVNFIMFQIGWFSAILGASSHHVALGLSVVMLVVLLHVARCLHSGREIRLILWSGGIGFVVESILILMHGYEPIRWLIPAPLCPLWLVAMWMNFATTINGCLRWLHPHLVWAALLGAVGGPAAYIAGAHLGAMQLNESIFWSLGLISIAWALALPGLFRLAATSADTDDFANDSESP